MGIPNSQNKKESEEKNKSINRRDKILLGNKL